MSYGHLNEFGHRTARSTVFLEYEDDKKILPRKRKPNARQRQKNEKNRLPTIQEVQDEIFEAMMESLNK